MSDDLKLGEDKTQIWVHGQLIKLGPVKQPSCFERASIKPRRAAIEEVDIPFSFEYDVARKVVISKMPLIVYFDQQVYSSNRLDSFEDDNCDLEGFYLGGGKNLFFCFACNTRAQTIRFKVLAERPPEVPRFQAHAFMWIYGYPYCEQQPYCFFCQDEINPHNLANRFHSVSKPQEKTKTEDKATLKRKHSPSKEEESKEAEANKK